MPRTSASRLPSDQIDFLLDDLETLRQSHNHQLRTVRQEMAKLQDEVTSLRTVIASQHSTLSGMRGLAMTPAQRDRLAGAILATARALGIKPRPVD